MNEMVKMDNKRNGLIDVYRLIMAVIIMIFHSYHLFSVSNYPFTYGRIFVEAFFLLSGYFTVSYFEKQKIIQGRIKLYTAIINSLKYTYRKYLVLIPFTATMVYFSLVIRHGVIANDLTTKMWITALFESLMLIRGDSNVGVLWYMSAMLPLLPILAFVVQITHKKIYGSLSLVAVLSWYVCLGRFDDCFAPLSYCRAVAGLSLGILAYCVKDFLDIKDFKKINLSTIAYLSLVIPIITNVLNIRLDRLCLICFVIGFAICFSSKSAQVYENNFTRLCGRISFPLYLVHMNVADFITWYCKQYSPLSTEIQYLVYFIISIIGVIVLMIINSLVQGLFKK